jgi:hypothetical protein
MIELPRLGLKIFVLACATASVASPRAGFAQQSFSVVCSEIDRDQRVDRFRCGKHGDRS